MAAMTANLKFKKLSSTAIEPTREHESDVGLDLYSTERANIGPNGGRKAISTGWAVEIPEGYYGKIEERSGFGSKSALSRKAGVIDSGYRGEIKIVMQNNSPYPIYVDPGTKIAQLIIHRQPKVTFEFVKELSDTARGEKGFGSSDKEDK